MFITKSYKNNSYLIFNHPLTQKKTKLSISTLEKILLNYYEDKPEIIVRLSRFEKEFMNAVNVRPATIWLYRRALNYLIELFGDIPINEITINQLEKFKEVRLKEVTKSTVNVDIRSLKVIFNTAVKWEYLEKNPARDLKLLRIEQKEILAFTDEQINLILNNSNELLKNITAFALLTGCRLNEILNVQIKDVCFTEQVIKIRNKEDFKTKTGKIRNIPISEKLLEVLKRILKKDSNIIELNKPEMYLFNKNGFKYNKDYITHSFKKILRATGIEERFHFHCLRHTFVTNLIKAGVNINYVKELAGHTNIQTTMNYINLRTNDLRDAVNRL